MFTPPRNFRATNIIRVVMSFALVLATLPIRSNSQAKEKPERRIKTLPHAKVLPDLEQTKQDGKIDKTKLPPVEAPKLPAANRCRPADFQCQEFWRKKGISQAPPTSESGIAASLARLLASNISPVSVERTNDYRNVSDMPFALSPRAVAKPMLMQSGGVSYGTMPTELAQRRNLTGGSGEDLFAGNYHWSLPIVGLPGRAGLDLGLSLHYNSHIWVKTTNNLMTMRDYSEDFGTPGFGFSIGLPVLRSGTHLNRAGLPAWLVMMPSGQAIEMVKRNGTGQNGVYESTDGSLLHFVVENADRYLYYPDGTRLKFNNQLCTEIRDRNGNLITTTYDPTYGYLTKLTDTTGREITFTYGSFFELRDIKQTRKDATGANVLVTLAHFGYSDITINTNFAAGLTKDVAANTVLPMLSSVSIWDSTSDYSLYKFDYTSYGQVKTIHHYATISRVNNPDTLAGFRELSLLSYNLPSTTTPSNNAAQTDCPRFTQRSDDAYLWDSGVLTTFTYGTNNAWGQVTTPDGTMQRESFNLAANNSESWKDGLPYKIEAYAQGQIPGSSTPKKTTLMTWENSTYGQRLYDRTVTDGENNRSRRLDYFYNSYNLPSEVDETETTSGAATMLHKTITSYVTSSPYIRGSGVANNTNPSLDQRWIVGLPTAIYSYDGANNLTAKVSYAYDQTTYAGDNLLVHQTPTAGTIFNFDTKYAVTSGSTAITARGNLTNITRWDITPGSESDSTKAVVRATQYNTTGSPTTQYLPNNNLTGRKTMLSYLDSWSDSIVNNTLAYPTTITDPDTFASTIKYRYDVGAVATTTDPKGAIYTRTYDPGSGRLLKIQNSVNQAYTRYVEGVGLSGLATYTKVLPGADFGQPGFNPATEYFS